MKRAKNGDAKALEWLSLYLVGRPTGSAMQLSKLAAAEYHEENSFDILGIVS